MVEQPIQPIIDDNKEEINPVPNVEKEETINPGFMDIDKIEQMAEDINKPEVKMPTEDLLKPAEPVAPQSSYNEVAQPTSEEPIQQSMPQGGKFFNMFNFSEPEKDESFIEDIEEGQVNMDFGDNLNNPSPFNPIIEPVQPEPIVEDIKEEKSIEPANDPFSFGESVSFDNEIKPVEPISYEEKEEELVNPTPAPTDVNPFNETVQPFSLTDDGFSTINTQPQTSYEQPAFERPYMMNSDVNFDEEGEIEVKLPNYNEPEIKVDMKTVINTIRECAAQIEKYGYKVDTDEIDLADTYEVTFRINKNN